LGLAARIHARQRGSSPLTRGYDHDGGSVFQKGHTLRPHISAHTDFSWLLFPQQAIVPGFFGQGRAATAPNDQPAVLIGRNVARLIEAQHAFEAQWGLESIDTGLTALFRAHETVACTQANAVTSGVLGELTRSSFHGFPVPEPHSR